MSKTQDMFYRIALRLHRRFHVENPNHFLDVDPCQLIEFLQVIRVRLLHGEKSIQTSVRDKLLRVVKLNGC